MNKKDFTYLPNHVAIIMDGNGRWAKKIGKKRAFGHESGTKSVKECINQSIKLGIKNLTLFVFSTENWSIHLYSPICSVSRVSSPDVRPIYCNSVRLANPHIFSIIHRFKYKPCRLCTFDLT